eukprot:20368-Pelagococcus_subviridis.AAC.1
MLDAHGARRARAHVREVAVLVKDRLRAAVRGVADDEHAAARGKAFLDVLVEAHARELYRPRRRAFDVSALDVAVPGAGGGGFRDPD